METDDLVFWKALDELAGSGDIVIDRAEGTVHPRYPDLVYPLDYGYLSGTVGGDGDGIDVWVSAGSDSRLNRACDTLQRGNCLRGIPSTCPPVGQVGGDGPSVATPRPHLNDVGGAVCCPPPPSRASITFGLYRASALATHHASPDHPMALRSS